MTADFAADIRVSPLPQTVVEAKSFLARGIELVKSQAPEAAIAQFTKAIKVASAILQSIPRPNPLNISEQPMSLAEVATVEVTLTQSFYHRGCAFCRLQNYKSAIADFTHLIHQPPTSSAIPAEWLITKLTEIYIHRGNAYRRLGEYIYALADLDQGITRSNGSAQSFGARGLLRLDMADFEGAIADFDQALAHHPTFVQGYLWRGFAYLRHGDPGLAITDLTRAITAIPTCAEAFNHRGVAHVYQHQLEAARADFDQAIRLKSDFAEAYSNRGNVRLLLGDRASATVDYDRAIALNPQLAELYFNRAAVSNGAGSFACREQTSIDDDITDKLPLNNAAFYRHRARERTNEGKPKAAISDYTNAIALSPTAHALYQRGLLYLSLGQSEQALADFDGAIDLSPDYGVVYSDRAQLRLRNNDLQGALADIEQAANLSPNLKQEIHATRCLIHFAMGHREQALADFEQLITQLRAAGQSSSHTSNDSTSIGSVGG